MRSIGNYAFSGCSGLSGITIPNSVASIGSYAFAYSALTGVTVPPNVTSVGTNIFIECGNLKSVTVLNGIIGTNMFAYCIGLTTVLLPSGVETIGSNAFYGCDNLVIYAEAAARPAGWSTNWNASRPVFWGVNDATFAQIDGAQYVSDGDGAVLTRYVGNASAFVIPDSVMIDGVSRNVTSFAAAAFANCDSLASFTTGNNITSIAASSFVGCTNLTSITVTSSVSSVNGSALSGIKNNLKSIVFKENSLVTHIEQGTFAASGSITSVIFEKNSRLTTIGQWAFNNCDNLAGFAIPASVTGIANYAFESCDNFAHITIPSSVASIGNYAFRYSVRMTMYVEAAAKPDAWSTSWNTNSRPVVWGCKLAEDINGVYVESWTKTGESSLVNPSAPNGFREPYRAGYTFGGWALSAENAALNIAAIQGTQLGAQYSGIAIGTTLYAIWA